MEMTPVGRIVDACLDHHDIVVHVGSRASAKTTNATLSLLRIMLHQGAAFRGFVGRESHSGALQLGNDLFLLLCLAFGPQNVTRNQNAGLISVKFPEGVATVEIRPFNDEKSYGAIQGKSYTFALFDEAGNYSKKGWELMFTIMSNIRGPHGLHMPVLILGNPFGASHGRVVKTFLQKSPWWESYTDDAGLRIINVRSTIFDNPHIDHDGTVARLKRACNGNKEKEKAWIYGDFNLNIASFFGNQFDPNVHLLPQDLIASQLMHLRPKLGGGADWGTRSACCFHLGLKLRADLQIKDHWYRAGSIFLMAECHTLADPDMTDLSTGSGIAPQGWAEMIKHLCINEQGLKAVPAFAQDDARGLSSDTVTSLMGQAGVPCHKPHKDRQGSFALMGQMLDAAKTGDGPGLYIHPSCRYLLATLPDAPANPSNPNDLDPRWGDDHAIDASAYATAFLGHRRGRHGTVKSPY